MIAPRTLRGRITLMMLVFGVLMIVVNHWWSHNWVRERYLSRLRAEAAESASPLAGILQHLLRRGQVRAAELELTYASLSPRLELGLVCDREGSVRLATQLQWRGMSIMETPLSEQWPLIQKVMDAEKPVSVWAAGNDGLVVASRFYEGYDAASKGFLVIFYDYSRELEQMKADTLHDFLRQVGVLSALCLLLWHVLDEMFMQRVLQMMRHCQGAASSGRMPKVLEGNDELALISMEFAQTVRQLRETESHLLEAAEEERRRLGRDLHDDLCQRITATKLKAEVVHELPPDAEEKRRMLTQQLTEELAESAEIARSIARGLSPVGLEIDGLEVALFDVASFVEKSFGARCTVSCANIEGLLSGSEQEMLFRVAQELAVNAGKHSRPKQMSISVEGAPTEVTLRVTHDGKPFDGKPEAEGLGMGLHLMQQRLITLAAVLERATQAGPPKINVTTVHIPRKRGTDNDSAIDAL